MQKVAALLAVGFSNGHGRRADAAMRDSSLVRDCASCAAVGAADGAFGELGRLLALGPGAMQGAEHDLA